MNNNPARVLLVFGFLDRGGAETLAMNIYRNIDRKKIQFDFIKHTDRKCDYDEEIKKLGGKIYTFPRYTVVNHLEYKKYWKDFLKQHPEYRVIHWHMTGPAAVAIPMMKKQGIYTIAHSHIATSQSGFRQKVIDAYQIPLRNMADELFACSQIAGEWLFGKDVSKRKNYRVIKNGVDTDEFAYKQEWRNDIRNELNLNDKFVLGDVARFHIQKNHSFLLDIFYEVYKKNNAARLLLVGEGELKNEMQEKARTLGVENAVVFAGVRNDINKILSAMDVFVMPSFREGLPVALVEAQAAGLHIVASDTISQEIKITDLVEMCSLNDSPEVWADVILKYAQGYERKNTKKEIEKAGYDIKHTAKWLQDFYLSKSR